jgi:ABC-type transporter Mla maintaining outer membrane lipid asymmetry ATPase subunit MlaF
MLFQESSLFDSLTVAANVGYQLTEEADMPADQVRQRVEEVLGFIGLQEHVHRMPSELSGGTTAAGRDRPGDRRAATPPFV